MDIDTSEIIGQSTSLKDVFKVLAKVAPTDSTVLVTGESGTGKELLVRALHRNSARKDNPFIPINCGAIPKDLLESELFGHEKGAFTHALRMRAGRFELADGGTVFLDEIGEMELSLQVKILRVLQEKEIERVGGTGSKKVDVRVVAATNRDLEKEVQEGRFREDLFYRLNVIPLHLPPLRERGGDVAVLANYFLEEFCKKAGRKKIVFDAKTRAVLEHYLWPGNVRELENIMERLSILVDGNTVTLGDLPQKIVAGFEDSVGDMEVLSADAASQIPVVEANVVGANVVVNSASGAAEAASRGFVWPTLADLQKHQMNLRDFLDFIEDKLLKEALDVAGGVKNQAAEVLGIKRTTLIEKLKKRNME
jgi:transcriptional regulator with GAF, ATPase, and Fis domain